MKHSDILCEHCGRDYPVSHFRIKRHPYRKLKGGDVAVTFTHRKSAAGCGLETEMSERDTRAA